MIKSFTDLKVWQESHKLSLEIYKLTKKFPSEEIYGLSSQMRRCSVSVASNLAEGFGRSSAKDREHFYVMSDGSLYELKSQLLLAKDLGYISQNQFEKIAEIANCAHKLLHGLLRSHKSNV